MSRTTRRLWAGLIALAAASGSHAESDGGFENVVVLAAKHEAPIQDVPIAVSALSGDELSAAGITDADGLAQQLTTLDLQRNAGLTTTSLRIRRVGNIGNIPTFEPAVGVFVDGAFRSRSFLGASTWLAVDHVEVLRGPQTALYGKNVSAGVLAVYSRKPADVFTVDGEYSHGWFDTPGQAADLDTVTVDMSGPIGSGVGGRIAAQFAQHDPTLLNVLPGGPDGNDERRTAMRAQLAGSPNDSLDWQLLAGYARENDNQGESDVFLAPGAGSTQVSNLLQQLGLTPGCTDNVPRNRKLCSVATNQLELEAYDLTLLGEYRLANGWRIRSMTSWDRYEINRTEDDAIQLFAPMLFYRDAEQGHSVQEELRLHSRDDTALTWLIGSFYYRNDYERGDRGRRPMFGANGELAYDPIWPVLLGGLPLAVPGQLGIHNSSLDTRYFSVFGQLAWQWTSQFSLTAGLRWQQEAKDAVIANSVSVPGPSLISAILTPAVTLGGEAVNGTLARKSEDLPWSITPQYRFSRDAMAYFTLARGTKSGGFNTGFGDAALADREFSDETIHHYELGVKLSLADRRVVLNAAAFYTQYDDYQDSAFVSAQFSVGNAQRVDLKGVEIEGSAQLHQNLALGFAVSRADLRYVTNTRGLCYPGRIPDGSLPGSCVLSGEHPIQAPEWETHLDLRYRRPVSWGTLHARLDWSWTDAYNTSFSADPRLMQDAYSEVAARAGVQWGSAIELELWGNNLLNETVSHFDSLLNLFNDASYQSYLAPPRSYGLTVRLHF